jgi:phosphoenolpyruvate-protein phosphotransferase/dihydroxyacetone kinase phosphotransfer subunit
LAEQAATVGLVLVCHSRPLALAAVDLAAEMLHGQPIRLAVAAGLDETTFGTDAVRIKEAIEEVDGPAGVVVLMDLGSAVLSAELALDLLADQAVRERVVLSPAAVVEGLVVASVAAAGGASRAEVAAEARDALLGKASHLADTPREEPPELDLAAEASGTFVVTNPHGLHARPAARLVGELRGFDATVSLRNLTTGGPPVPGSSLSRVATLAALQGHSVEIKANGPQAGDVVKAVLALADRSFDEAPEPDVRPETPSSTAVGPLPAAPGIAIGPARRFTRPVPPDDADEPVLPPEQEWLRLEEAIGSARRDLEQLRTTAVRELGAAEGGIFDAHLELLADSELLDDAHRAIVAGARAGQAWRAAIRSVETTWAGLPDSYLQARAADVRAVGDDVLLALTGGSAATLVEPGILVAADLTPAQAATLDVAMVMGIVLAQGSASSHAAILARARGIPAVVGAGPDVLRIAESTLLALNGSTGALVVDPSVEAQADYRALAERQATVHARELADAGAPAVTRDGVQIEVGANLGSVADARDAAAGGADNAGLVRTEFLFLGRDRAPTVEEQAAEYAAIGSALGGRRITLRTLDVGGDKPLPYVPAPVEDNPFLGLRGIRLALQEKNLLAAQLQAICRAARQTPVDIMFPMVSQVQELRDALDVLRDAAGPDGLPAGLRVGIMVEVPATALNVAAFLPHLDFLSIGTNDLTQYALAAERGNPHVAGIYDVLDPGVLSLIGATCAGAEGRVPVGVCGESAADPLALPILLGLGVRHVSVSPAAVPQVKAQVRTLDLAQCRALAEQALAAGDSRAVRRLVGGASATS